MDVTKSHHPNSIVLGSAKLEITKSPVTIDTAKKDWSLQQDLLDLGLARGVKISFESSKLELKADNGTVPIKGLTDVKAKVEFVLLERHLPDIAVAMAGLVNVKEIKGKKTYTQEFVFTASYTGAGASGRLTVDKKEFEHKGKDYKITKIISQSGIKFNSGGSGAGGSGATAIAIDLKVEDFKISLADGTLEIINTNKLEDANARYTISLEYEVDDGTVCYQLTKGSGGIAQPIAMKLTNKRKADDGRIITRTFELPYGFYTGDDSITLKSKNDTDNIAEIPMSFEFTPHPDMVDDNELSEMSLYREIAEL